MEQKTQKAENYYEILGVDRDADINEIRRVYIEKIKQWHPDTAKEDAAKAEEMTKLLNAAYATLKDPAARKQYDRMLRYTGSGDFGQTVNEQNFQRKFRSAASVFRSFSANVIELFNLFKDSVNGSYHLHPVSLGTLGAGLLYFIVPTDLIPDFLPFVGFLDDMAVLTMVANSLHSELESYRKWRTDPSSKS